MPRRPCLNPEVFLEAAENVSNSMNFACCAISRACECRGMDASEERKYQHFFRNLFKPPEKQMYDPEIGVWWAWHDWSPRVMALLLAAEIAKEGGL